MKTRNLFGVIILTVLLLIYAGASQGPCMMKHVGGGPYFRSDYLRQTMFIVPDGSREAADDLQEPHIGTFGFPAKSTFITTLIELLLLWLLPHPFFRIPGLLLHCLKSFFAAWIYLAGVFAKIGGPYWKLTAYGKGVMVLAAVIAVGYVVQFALDIRSRRAAR